VEKTRPKLAAHSVADVIADNRTGRAEDHQQETAAVASSVTRAEDKHRFTGERQTHAFECHDHRNGPIAVAGNKGVEVVMREKGHVAPGPAERSKRLRRSSGQVSKQLLESLLRAARVTKRFRKFAVSNAREVGEPLAFVRQCELYPVRALVSADDGQEPVFARYCRYFAKNQRMGDPEIARKRPAIFGDPEMVRRD
jgi:hypothetical protein